MSLEELKSRKPNSIEAYIQRGSEYVTLRQNELAQEDFMSAWRTATLEDRKIVRLIEEKIRKINEPLYNMLVGKEFPIVMQCVAREHPQFGRTFHWIVTLPPCQP